MAASAVSASVTEPAPTSTLPRIDCVTARIALDGVGHGHGDLEAHDPADLQGLGDLDQLVRLVGADDGDGAVALDPADDVLAGVGGRVGEEGVGRHQRVEVWAVQSPLR